MHKSGNGATSQVGTRGAPSAAGTPACSLLRHWADESAFRAGDLAGLAVAGGSGRFAGHSAVVWRSAAGRSRYADPFGHGAVEWEYARWTSPWTDIGFEAAELIPSWSASTPLGSSLSVRVQVRDAEGLESAWFTLAHWAADDQVVHRTTVPGQTSPFGSVEVDTLVAPPARLFGAYRLGIDLLRTPDARVSPELYSVSVLASAPAGPAPRAVSGPGGAWGTVLDVPQRSQEVHTGHCPQYDGGGEAWAGPACTAMMVSHFGRGPTPAELAWIDPGDPAPDVDFTARGVYDYAYRGCGNWAFNAAYAARFGLLGFVTRLPSLTEVERFIRAGIPVATAQAFRSTELSGAGYSTAGNIMVVCGFTDTGDVVVNDPLSPSDEAVRRTYPRADFERVWLVGGGGAVYIVHPPERALPSRTAGLPCW
ncbi:peptidase C39 family protein [Streptomyces sp. cmx-4-9]|uniref:peptidase C39 family protein n=1 Tax=Streptomyces sp. cmx-4-9 TaxID=2790941 RepID=UPI00398126DD